MQLARCTRDQRLVHVQPDTVTIAMQYTVEKGERNCRD